MNDAFLWYNVGDWANYGLAVPNYANDQTSQNSTIRYLVEVMGRNLQACMWHTDARRRTPPSINTITRIHKLCVRARSILATRAVPHGTPKMESKHAVPAPEDFVVYPTPYFRVQNAWMKEYAGLVLLALTDAIQHTENAETMEISTDFAAQIGQYIQRIYLRMSVELLRIDPTAASAPDFTLTDDQLRTYDPTQWFSSTEAIDTVPSLSDWPTEDRLKPLTDGIPVSQLPVLGRWPAAGGATTTSQGNTATANESFIGPPSP